MTRRSTRLRLAIVALALAFADPSVAAPRPGSEEDAPLAALRAFFSFDAGLPASFRQALDAYEAGRFLDTLAELEPAGESGIPGHARDDAAYLRGLAFVALGWDDQAVAPLVSVLESPEPGPYYVPALLELVEIHDRAGRWESVAESWRRYADEPLRSPDDRSGRISDFLFEYGTLRPPVTKTTRREKKWLAKPEELAVVLEKRRDRASDRLLYRSGLALLRLERHEESLAALLMIGIESPYYPYARYSIAQTFFALGRVDEAIRTLVRLDRYPKISPEERALHWRSRLLRAAMLFEIDEPGKAIGVSISVPDEDPHSVEARLLIVSALLESDQPALALAYVDEGETRVTSDVDAKRALAISEAFGTLGDRDSAAKVLRQTAASVHRSRMDGSLREAAIEKLRDRAARLVQERIEREERNREVIAGGIREVLAYDGPWNLGTLLRRLRVTLGARSYYQLVRGTKAEAPGSPGGDELWAAYLESAERPRVEKALRHLADLEERDDRKAPRLASGILNGALAWLESAPADPEERRRVAIRWNRILEKIRSESGVEAPGLGLDTDEPIPSQVAACRGSLPRVLSATAEVDELVPEYDRVVSLLESWAGGELRRFIEKRDSELLRLELDLDVALAGIFVEQAGASQRY